MSLIRQDVRKLLYRLGFMHAHSWNDDKLREMALEVSKHITAEQIPPRYQDLYEQLSKYARTGAYIEWKNPGTDEKL